MIREQPLDSIQEGSKWFKRLYTDLRAISKYVRFKAIRAGFYRIYFKEAYIGEVYKDMPEHGYDIEELDMKLLEDKQYIQSKMDDGEAQRKLKNFVEGYWEAKDKMVTRLYNFRHSIEAYNQSVKGYGEMRIK